MELGGLPQMLEFHPERRTLLGPGRTIRVAATDTTDPAGAWLVDLTGDTMVHRPAGDEDAAATLSAPLTTLLLALYARLPLDADGVTVAGDAELVRTWWKLSGFG